MTLTALVRPPTAALARCELTHVAREPIDVERAREQHAAYCALLAELGCEVVALEPLEDQPDACFVEDVAVVLDRVAVIPVPGAASRRGEVESVAAALEPHRELLRMQPPTTVDGGDVLRIGDMLYVGWSSRTNHAGLRALAHLLFEHRSMVKACEVRGALHLKTAATYVGRDTVLANARWANLERMRDLRLLAVPPEEPFGANALRIGETLVVAAEHPRTAELLDREGFDVRTVALGELAKAEAGPTCLSLLVE